MTQPQMTATARQIAPPATDIPEQDLFEHLLAYIKTWTHIRQRYHAQFAHDARLTEREIAAICQQLQRTDALALALRHFAQQLEQEADETTDRLHTWCYD
ncbi:MAG: hypothetical protein K8S97_16380 [Anaerolineae bacterium]|nr:hypothetical protein [Anaerolineae bacterium]